MRDTVNLGGVFLVRNVDICLECIMSVRETVDSAKLLISVQQSRQQRQSN